MEQTYIIAKWERIEDYAISSARAGYYLSNSQTKRLYQLNFTSHQRFSRWKRRRMPCDYSLLIYIFLDNTLTNLCSLSASMWKCLQLNLPRNKNRLRGDGVCQGQGCVLRPVGMAGDGGKHSFLWAGGCMN